MGPQAKLPALSLHATRSGLAAVPRWTPPTLSLVPGPLGSETHKNRSGPPQSSADSPPWKNTELCRTRVWPPIAQVTERQERRTDRDKDQSGEGQTRARERGGADPSLGLRSRAPRSPHSLDYSPTLPTGRSRFSYSPELEPAASTASPGPPEMVWKGCGQGWGGGPLILR